MEKKTKKKTLVKFVTTFAIFELVKNQQISSATKLEKQIIKYMNGISRTKT